MFMNENRLNDRPDALGTLVNRSIGHIDDELSALPGSLRALDEGYRVRLTIARSYTTVEYESPDEQSIQPEDIHERADDIADLLAEHADELSEQAGLSMKQVANCADCAEAIRDRFEEG